MRDYAQFSNRPHSDVRTQLLRLGMQQESASAAIPFVWFSPSTTDPYSPVIIMLVEAVQARLRARRYPVEVTGYLDDATAAALTRAVGPRWQFRPWVVVVGQLLAGHKSGRADTLYEGGGLGAQTPPSSLGGVLDDVFAPIREIFDRFRGGTGSEMSFDPIEASFRVERGTCVPTTAAVHRRFQAFQRALNSAQVAFGIAPRVAVNGRIDAGTLAAAHRVAAKAPTEVGGLRLARSCAVLAKTASRWTPLLQRVGARRRPAGGPGSATTPPPPGVRWAAVPMPVVAAAAGVGLVYLLKRQGAL